MTLRVRAPQGQFVLERVLDTGDGDALTLEIEGFDLTVLDSLARRAAAAVTDVLGVTDVRISQKDGVPQQRITIDRDRAADLGLTVRDVEERLAAIPRPVGYDLLVVGSFETQQKAFHELMIGLVLALVLVYMVLACQYESLRDPLVVMFSVPVAAVGVLVTLVVTSTTLITLVLIPAVYCLFHATRSSRGVL